MCKKIISLVLLLSINNFALASGYWVYDSATSTYIKKDAVVEEVLTTQNVNNGIAKKYDFPETDDNDAIINYSGSDNYTKANNYNAVYYTTNTATTSTDTTTQNNSNQSFSEKHPVLTGLGVGVLVVGAVAVALLANDDNYDSHKSHHSHHSYHFQNNKCAYSCNSHSTHVTH